MRATCTRSGYLLAEADEIHDLVLALAWFKVVRENDLHQGSV